MSEQEIDRLQKELAQAKAREEQAKAREEQAKASEEQAKAREEQAKEREEHERRKNQKTTLTEYLYNCHFHLHQKLSIADPSQCSTGNTSVEGKYYPKWLRPWHEFESTHLPRHFKAIQSACKGRRLFHQETTTRDLGSSVFRKRARNENDIDNFEKTAVEDPVWEILQPLWDDKDLTAEYRCSQVRFSNNRRDVIAALSQGRAAIPEDLMEDSRERKRRTGPGKRTASQQRVKPPSTKPDGWGIRVSPNGDESHAFAFDYKAAHKISTELVRSAVAKETLFMEVTQRICNGKINNDVAREQEKAEEFMAMALTQVFDYMVRYEVAYSYVAMGKALLLLHVDRADLQTLYCHPCVPEEDVGTVPDGVLADDTMMYTAVAQLASFFLLSLRSEALRGVLLEEALQTAAATLKIWKEPYDDAVSIVGVDKTDSSPLSSQEAGSRYTSSVSPIHRQIYLRSSSCKTADLPTEHDDEDDEPSEQQGRHQPKMGTNKRKGTASSSPEGESTQMSSSAPTRQYCTQTCLLGLKRGLRLDDNCPNVRLHRTVEGCSRHPLSAQAFTRLMCQQLRRDPYYKCDALDRRGKWGSVGMLFKLELEPYGYTLVGKGALSGHPHDLEHEGAVYARLDKLQGHVVPVHLGLVTLDRGHLIAGGIRIFDVMLMSWGGEKASEAELPDLAREARRSSQAIWAEGVDHNDERAANQLWNDERQQVMIVDFDKAILLSKPRNRLLLEVTGERRERAGGDCGRSQKRRWRRGQTQVA
ncbi:hypothetical protein PWT90_07312 [Aphanocladium album]|nr:hypothetical protein PWT90_07312 [Aphanocladium album]